MLYKVYVCEPFRFRCASVRTVGVATPRRALVTALVDTLVRSVNIPVPPAGGVLGVATNATALIRVMTVSPAVIR